MGSSTISLGLGLGGGKAATSSGRLAGGTPFTNEYSVSLDGTNDYIGVPASTDFSFGTSDFSISAWFNPEVVSGYRSIVDFRPSNGDMQISLFNSPNNEYKLYAWAGSTKILNYNITLNTNQWYNVVYTRSGTTATLYLNGSSVATGSDSNNYSINGEPKWGGLGAGVGANTFNGELDECAVLIQPYPLLMLLLYTTEECLLP